MQYCSGEYLDSPKRWHDLRSTVSTEISSQIRTELRDWAVWQARAGCYSQAALSSNDSKTLYNLHGLFASLRRASPPARDVLKTNRIWKAQIPISVSISKSSRTFIRSLSMSLPHSAHACSAIYAEADAGRRRVRLRIVAKHRFKQCSLKRIFLEAP